MRRPASVVKKGILLLTNFLFKPSSQMGLVCHQTIRKAAAYQITILSSRSWLWHSFFTLGLFTLLGLILQTNVPYWKKSHSSVFSCFGSRTIHLQVLCTTLLQTIPSPALIGWKTCLIAAMCGAALRGAAVAAAARRSRRSVAARSVGRRSVDSRGNASVDDKQYITIDLVRIVNTTHS